MAAIAILDDDEDFRDFLCALLEGGGHKPTAFGTAGKLLDSVLKHRFDLFVVDVGLPGMDGRELVRILKHNPETRSAPAIVVSGQAVSPEEAAKGFNDGADEYLRKPFEGALFLLRVRSLLDRAAAGPAPGETLAVGPIRVGVQERSVEVGGRSVELTRLEFDLLEFLLRNPGRVMTRAILLQEVWRQPPDVTSRTVDKHVESLRRKLGPPGDGIETVVGLGYTFRPQKADTR